jgi:YqaJ-like recombinase protein
MNEQGTQAWRDERAGDATASKVGDIMTKPRKEGEGVRANYRAKLICERLTGNTIEEEYQSYEMRRGTELEPLARAQYELRSDLDISTVGYIKHPSIPRFGASPDGLVGDDGLIQIKCGKRATHAAWLLAGVVPLEHRPQMFAEMAVTGRKWSDFCSYNRDFPEHLQLFVRRLERDEAEIKRIEEAVMKFNAEIDEIIAKLPKANGEQDLTELLQDSLEAVK